MSKRNLIDLAALSDPTDSHSLEELRAHLEDGGDMQPDGPQYYEWYFDLSMPIPHCDEDDCPNDARLIIGRFNEGQFEGWPMCLGHARDFWSNLAELRDSERSGGDGA